MKRLFSILIVAFAMVTSGRSETAAFYINNNVINATTVENAPQIDATNFVNRNLFQLNLGFFGNIPYDFSNTENFTNNNIMSSFPVGFRFDTAPSSAGVRKRAKNFANAGPAVSPANASITAASKLIVNASNIVNRGTLTVGSLGVISLEGNRINLNNGSIQVGPTTGAVPSGQYDNYWGMGTNRLVPSVNLTAEAPFTPVHQAIQLFGGGFYFTNSAFLAFGLPGLTAESSIVESGTNRTVQIVFLYHTNPEISTEISFSPDQSPADFGIPSVEWGFASTNAVTGEPLNNTLYLHDIISLLETNVFVENFPNGLPPPTYRPENFVFSSTPLFGGIPGATYTTPAPEFWGTNAVAVVSNSYASYSLRLSPLTFEPSAGVSGSTISALPGRIDIDAEESLSLNSARIQAANYVRINAANQFLGATNASVSTPFADIFLGNTNGSLNTLNVLLPTIPRFTGNIDVYSSIWTNDVVAADGTNVMKVPFHVLFVDSSTLQGSITPQVINLVLNSTNVLIGDTFQILSNVNVTAENLTIAPSGRINLNSVTANWISGVPKLKNFTNNGFITAPNSLYFFGSAPDGSDLPYDSFVNRGIIASAGNTISAAYVENRGTITASTGAIDISGGDVLLLDSGTTNASLLSAVNSEILITAGNLTISNQIIRPGRSLSLWVSGHIQDGFPAVTNRITTGDGFNLFVKPATGDLQYTVITNNASPYQSVPNWWAGEDRGLTSAGFINNAALGKMVLNGAANSFYTFYPAGTSNALYVGTLELVGAAALTNAAGDLSNLGVASGMKIYFSYLYIDGIPAPPELLDGKNGGAFSYLSSGGVDIASAVIPDGGPSGPGFDVDLRVSNGNPPGSAVLVSWNTVDGAVNRVYYKDGLADTQWHLLKSFVSGADGRVDYPDAVKLSGRVYKVELDLPAP